MRSLIKLLAVLLICLMIIGYFRGWFSVSRSVPAPESDTVNVTMSVDKGKIRSDVKEAKKKVKEEIKELKGNVTQ